MGLGIRRRRPRGELTKSDDAHPGTAVPAMPAERGPVASPRGQSPRGRR
jgi:hypothetical protein